MTPPAATVAARQRIGSSPARGSRASANRSQASRRVASRTTSVRSVRRLSGPQQGVTRASAVALPPVALPRVRKPKPAALPRPKLKLELPKLQLAGGLARLRELSLLDRLLRGRLWILVVGAMLMGIVAMQVSMLKLNAGIGRAVDQETALTQSNTEMKAEISRLSSPERIRLSAEALGMKLPGAGSIKYLRVRPNTDPKRVSDAVTNGSLKPNQNVQSVPSSAVPPVSTPVSSVTPQAPSIPPAASVPPTGSVPSQSDPTQAPAAGGGTPTSGVVSQGGGQ